MKPLTGAPRWNLRRILSAPLLGALASLLVTACDGRVAVSDNVGLVFATPSDGAIVSRLDDVDPVDAGIQMNVVVQVTARDGTEVMLEDDVDPSAAVSAMVA